MPTYEYECEKCGNKFEAFQQMNDKPVDKCPSCGEKPKRLISAGAGLIFKGSGFYATDYRSAGYPAAAGSRHLRDKSKAKEEAPPCGAADKNCSSCPNKT